jgi:hypothetical protein
LGGQADEVHYVVLVSLHVVAGTQIHSSRGWFVLHSKQTVTVVKATEDAKDDDPEKTPPPLEYTQARFVAATTWLKGNHFKFRVKSSIKPERKSPVYSSNSSVASSKNKSPNM